MQTFAPMREPTEPRTSGNRIFDLVSDELALVEDEFDRQASSNIQVIDYLGDYLRESGGKRVRPALLILANYAIGGRGADERVIRLATVMEMLHTATLVHDDIIDNAAIRRSRASVNARFGNQTAVLMGDWLYMSAFETTVRERSLEIIDILTRLTRKMTEGELIQLTTIGSLTISNSEYLDILCRKTAFLFSACCQVGAILGGASESVQRAMADYGMQLGIAFQLIDDLLDFTAKDNALGKTAGSDLLQGKVTLPLILLLKKEPAMTPAIEKIMLDGSYRGFTREELNQKLASYGIIDEVKAEAEAHASLARKSIDVLPETEYRLSLEDILRFVIDRTI
jgi:octaprenyl-diphosphate synthase